MGESVSFLNECAYIFEDFMHKSMTEYVYDYLGVIFGIQAVWIQVSGI